MVMPFASTEMLKLTNTGLGIEGVTTLKQISKNFVESTVIILLSLFSNQSVVWRGIC